MTTVDKFDIASQINDLTDRMRHEKVDLEFFGGPTGLFLLGALFGATFVYLLDPISGGRRRSLIRNKGLNFSKVVDRFRDRKSRELRNRNQGFPSSMRT